MALSIEHHQAEELASQLAAVTGETVTQAVIHALEERLHRVKERPSGPALAAALLDISERCSALPDLDARSPDEILDWDEHGGFR
ncbi:MAG TPA: type II toxin-antitoxin system VapB family antitoxin [Thermoanaerobaculia bacterium]|nr:type II toxin-antitoxin system VapB family antitoxin [Thermoanaerobaculia bacterium]